MKYLYLDTALEIKGNRCSTPINLVCTYVHNRRVDGTGDRHTLYYSHELMYDWTTEVFEQSSKIKSWYFEIVDVYIPSLWIYREFQINKYIKARSKASIL